jgi:hypothetical protein
MSQSAVRDVFYSFYSMRRFGLTSVGHLDIPLQRLSLTMATLANLVIRLIAARMTEMFALQS